MFKKFVPHAAGSIIITDGIITIAFLLLSLSQHSQDRHSSVTITANPYIVQADSLGRAMSAVRSVGGEITHELNNINAVGT